MPALLLCFTAGPLPSELIQLWRKLGAFLPAHHWLQQQQNMTVVLQHYVSQQGSDFCDFGEEGEDLYPMKGYLIQEASGLAHFINQ